MFKWCKMSGLQVECFQRICNAGFIQKVSFCEVDAEKFIKTLVKATQGVSKLVVVCSGALS